MKTQLFLLALAVSVGLSACGDSALPTDAGRDLLNNPSGAPSLGDSKYGNILDDGDTEEEFVNTDEVVGEPEVADEADASDEATPSRHHITSGPLRSKYSTIPLYHITEGALKTSYSNIKWYHITSGPLKSSYSSRPIQHVASGANATRYKPAPTPVPVDTTVTPGTGVPANGSGR